MTSFFCSPYPKKQSVKGVTSLSFDPSQFGLRELFFKSFDLSHSASETDFLKFLDQCDLNKTISLGHKALRSSEFDDFFFLILDELSVLYGPLAYQARPTFRIQKVGNRSVPFHTDEISSGHPDQIINIWIPLVNLNSKNTLHFVDKDNTLRIKTSFIAEKRSIEWITQESVLKSRPWIGRYGELVVFSNHTLHGTAINTTSPRASIDFRILPMSENVKMNKKRLGSDYLVLKESNSHSLANAQRVSSQMKATSLIFSNADASHLSHSLQRQIVNEFAGVNSFIISRETAEWQTMHFPILQEILDKQPDMSILFSSQSCFSVQGEYTDEFLRLLPKLQNHPSPIWFCFENRRVN